MQHQIRRLSVATLQTCCNSRISATAPELLWFQAVPTFYNKISTTVLQQPAPATVISPIVNNRTENLLRTSNHGSFYYNQLASVQVLLGDTTGAQKTIEEYFSGIYLGQIAANGDQVSLRDVQLSNLC